MPLLWSPLPHKKTGDHKFGHFFARSHRQQNCKSPRCMGSSSKSLASPWISQWFSTPRQIYGSKMLGEMNRKNPIFGEEILQKVLSKQNTGGDGFLEAFWKNITFSPSWKVSVFRGAVFTKNTWRIPMANSIHMLRMPSMGFPYQTCGGPSLGDLSISPL